ncbi:MAG TPA: ABC transporter substrate-binding protein [Rubrobacteraceae bacterium]|nr:ABC transporter substrate-binding protein [Rubrobacteraceae bacterium]
MEANDGASSARTISRRDFLKVGGAGLAAAALLGVAGCGGGQEQGGGGATELVFTASPDDTETASKLVDKFNEQNKGKYKVSFRPGNADTGQRFDALRTQLQAGGENLDVILGDVIWTAQLAENGWISDLSDRFTEDMRGDYLPGSVEAITYKGKTFGMPWFTDTGLLYYRKDLLQKSGFDGPPKTWDELKQMALKVKQDSGIKFGYVFQGANYEGGVCDGCEFIWTHGGEVLDPQNPDRVLVGQPEAIAGLTTYYSMIAEGVAPKAVTTYKEDESAGAFLNGDAVFLRNWPYVYAIISDPSESKVKPEQVGVSELPSADGEPGNGTVGDQPLYINATSKNPDAAWEFIQFMTAPEQQKFRIIEGSYLPTLKALYDDAEVKKKVPIAALAKDALQHTRPRPVSPYYADMSLQMSKHFNAALKGDETPEEAARTLQDKLEEYIKQGKEEG